jgi:hypothetical protein
MVEAHSRCAEHPVAFDVATVGDAMSNGVISCPAETPLSVVAQMMVVHSVHAIFVFQPGEEEEAPLWAVVSDLDLVAATQLDLETMTAGGSAVTPLVSVASDRSRFADPPELAPAKGRRQPPFRFLGYPPLIAAITSRRERSATGVSSPARSPST